MEIAPKILSTERNESAALPLAMPAGCAGKPGFRSSAWPRLAIAGVATGAAAMYATTIVFDLPGARSIGPDDWKNRMSSLDCVTKQTCVCAGMPPLLHGASPAVGSSLAER